MGHLGSVRRSWGARPGSGHDYPSAWRGKAAAWTGANPTRIRQPSTEGLGERSPSIEGLPLERSRGRGEDRLLDSTAGIITPGPGPVQRAAAGRLAIRQRFAPGSENAPTRSPTDGCADEVWKPSRVGGAHP